MFMKKSFFLIVIFTSTFCQALAEVNDSVAIHSEVDKSNVKDTISGVSEKSVVTKSKSQKVKPKKKTKKGKKNRAKGQMVLPSECKKLVNLIKRTGEKDIKNKKKTRLMKQIKKILKDPKIKEMIVTCKDSFNRTLFHHAATIDSLEIIKLLLEKTPEEKQKNLVNRQDKNDNTSILIAAQKGNIKIIVELLKVGADPSIKNNKGEMADTFIKDLIKRQEILENVTDEIKSEIESIRKKIKKSKNWWIVQ